MKSDTDRKNEEPPEGAGAATWRGAVVGSGGIEGMPVCPSEPGAMAINGSREEPRRSSRRSVGTPEGTSRGRRQEGGAPSPPDLTAAKRPCEGPDAQAPTPSSADPGGPLGGAGNGRDQEWLFKSEPGAGGRGFDRGKTGENRSPLEIGGAGGLARGERGDRGPATGRAIAGPTPEGRGQLGSGSVVRFPARHIRGGGRHVVADEPIAAAGLGRLERAQRHQCEHHHDPTAAEEPRLKPANAEEPRLKPANAEEPRLKMVKQAHGFDTLVGDGWIAAKGRPPRTSRFPPLIG